MIKTNGKLKRLDGIVFCFLAAIAIAAVALNIGLHVEPGKILPTGLSMRSEELNENLLRGIDHAIEDIGMIKAGVGQTDLWRLLTFVHLDLFFYLALIMPAAASKTILLIGYYVRFGLCCSAMYYFMSEHIKLNRLSSALLAVMYAFSSQIVLTAQFSSVMNMAIMVPVLMSAFDSYLQKRTWKAYVLVCVCSFGLCATGGFGLITGVPAMIFISLLMCLSLYRTFAMTITSWLKLLSGLVVGLILDMAFAIPGMAAMDISVNVNESFKNAKMTYKLFDLIRGSYFLRSGSISSVGIPVFYVGILTLVAVAAFALNEQIPVRIKVCAVAVLTVIHVTCSSSFVNETVSVFGIAPVVNSSKLIMLGTVIFFVAGIGLKNLKSLDRGGMIAAGIIPLFFLIVSGVDAAGTTLASPITISTFLAMILDAVLVYAIAKDKLTNKAKYVILVLGFIFVGINAAFIMFNNTIPGAATEEYFSGNKSSDTSSELIFDETFNLPAISENDQYLLVPANLSRKEREQSVLEDINCISERISGSILFESVFVNVDEASGAAPVGSDMYKLSGGRNSLTLTPFTDFIGDRVFLYCNAKNGASVRVNTNVGDYERVFSGPFITELQTDSSDFSIRLTLRADEEETCFISVCNLNEYAYNEMLSASGSTNADIFSINGFNENRIYTVILPFTYDDADIKVNGASYGTFDFCGRTALVFDSAATKNVEISLVSNNIGITPGIIVSLAAALCLVAIPVIRRYNGKKEVSGEGNKTNA